MGSRIARELAEIMKKDNDLKKNLFCIELVDAENMNHLKGKICGPPGTCFENGIFMLDIKIPPNYPFQPPQCRFETRIWHPNISSVTGAICLDILKDQWAAAMTLGTVLLSIQALMSAPEPDDPQDAVVAAQYKHQRKLYFETARFWTAVYAMNHLKENEKPTFPQFDGAINKVKKACSQSKANDATIISTLSCNNWDSDKAISLLATERIK